MSGAEFSRGMRRALMVAAGFAKLVGRAGIEAKLPFKCHPHMLRHATGFRVGKQRNRHPNPTSLSRPSLNSVHGALHRTGTLTGLAGRKTTPSGTTPCRTSRHRAIRSLRQGHDHGLSSAAGILGAGSRPLR